MVYYNIGILNFERRKSVTEFFQNGQNLGELLSVFIVVFVDFCALMILLAAGRERKRGDEIWAKEAKGYMLSEHGTIYPLGAAEIIIGRHPSADIRFSDKEISRFHAILTLSDGRWHIEDLGSGSGTYVNGVRIKTPRTLHRDDEIRIGRRSLRVIKGNGKVVSQ